jgi:hypothetical protein
MLYSAERNTTPTFCLTPGEKPDMSPYLFHLTTEKKLESILKDKKLQASIPRGSENSFSYKIVCFTETPIFALDFFRYRWSNNRERLDLNYGIGFSKEKMVNRGVYPAIYASKDLNSSIKSIFSTLEKLENLSGFIDQNFLAEILEVRKQFLPLLTPMFEKMTLQGFMWEREWRIEGDFEFDYDDIEYICCPLSSKQKIVDIVGSNKIEFLENWEQYNEITDFIKTQHKTTKLGYNDMVSAKINIGKKINYYEKISGSLEALREFKKEIEKEIEQRDVAVRQKILERIKKKFTDGQPKKIDNLVLSQQDVYSIVMNIYLLMCIKVYNCCENTSTFDLFGFKIQDKHSEIKTFNINSLEDFILNDEISKNYIKNNILSENLIKEIKEKTQEKINKIQDEVEQEFYSAKESDWEF